MQTVKYRIRDGYPEGANLTFKYLLFIRVLYSSIFLSVTNDISRRIVPIMINGP